MKANFKIDNEKLEANIDLNLESFMVDSSPRSYEINFTNNIFQKDGGTHVLGFRSALTRIINKYANEHNLLKKNN